jgi:hypothetical protein
MILYLRILSESASAQLAIIDALKASQNIPDVDVGMEEVGISEPSLESAANP